MENTTLDLAILDAKNLPELKGWEQKQQDLLKENPFIEITDKESYEIAKKRRTALITGRTDIEKQDKTIASVVAKFRKSVKSISESLITITKSAEEKQQAEVKRYETILENERLEQERIENEKVEGLKHLAFTIKTQVADYIKKMTYQAETPKYLEDFESFLAEKLEDADFGDYVFLFDEHLTGLEDALQVKVNDLQNAENLRVANAENERLKAEQAEKDAELAKLKAEQEKRNQEILAIQTINDQRDALDMHLETVTVENYTVILPNILKQAEATYGALAGKLDGKPEKELERVKTQVRKHNEFFIEKQNEIEKARQEQQEQEKLKAIQLAKERTEMILNFQFSPVVGGYRYADSDAVIKETELGLNNDAWVTVWEKALTIKDNYLTQLQEDQNRINRLEKDKGILELVLGNLTIFPNEKMENQETKDFVENLQIELKHFTDKWQMKLKNL